jgi:transposase
MGQAVRTTKLFLDLGKRNKGGANTDKRSYLDATADVLTQARSFYLDFFLAHTEKLAERVSYYSEKHLEQRERRISSNELLTWAESCTVATKEHPHPWEGWNFTERFIGMPFVYRRAAIKDAIGKARSYLSNLSHWQKSGKKKGRPGLPGAANHPSLYEGTIELDLSNNGKERTRFVRLKVYTGTTWQWLNYPIKNNRYFQQRLHDPAWEKQSPKLVLRTASAELHFSQIREISAKKIAQSKLGPDLVTVAVDLNVKFLAVITVKQRDHVLESRFVPDQGLDQHRFKHLKSIAKKQWQSGKPVKGEQSNQQPWRHIRRMNEDAAHRVARIIADVCARYPDCVLVFERLRKIRPKGGSKSHRMNRKQANQLRGKINQRAREKAYALGIVTAEVNPHGTSQYCSRCGARGERFSYLGGKRITVTWGKLFGCPICHYETQADLNASLNLHHSFYGAYHWQPRLKRSG